VPTHHLANKCIHDESTVFGWVPTRAQFYKTALGGATWYRTAVGFGSTSFPHVWNYCGWTIGSGLSSTWSGDIPNFAMANDDESQIGWFNPIATACGGSVLACSQSWGFTSGGRFNITETDIAIDPTRLWTDGAYAGFYDLQSVMAHEFGHAWGFGHTSTSVWAGDHTMYPSIWDGNVDQRYLALGDYNVMRSNYP
jgi:hypothetical protein